MTSCDPLGYKRGAIMKLDAYHSVCSARGTSAVSKQSAARYANWCWRVANGVAGVAFNEERETE
ncbi:MAG: hypothetical protein ABR556_08725 [Pyrinomonadaceae bacterium]